MTVIFPHARVSGMQDLYPSWPLRRVLSTRFSMDTHFALYEARDEPRVPRLTKAAFGADPALQEAVRLRATALDYDQPDHAPVEDPQVLLASLRVFFDRHPGFRPTHIYLTRAGARLIWEHDELPPHQAEALHQTLVRSLATLGLACDPNVWDWTRLFRAPHATRDGVPLDLPNEIDFGGPLDLTRFNLEETPRAFDLPAFKDPQPDWEQAKALVWEPTAGHRSIKHTQWAREAQRRLKHRMDGELDLFFLKDPPPLTGKRNDVLMRCIGSAASLLHNEISTTPEHLFGLFLPRTLQSMKPDGRDLPQELWKMIGYCWSHEEGLRAHNEEQTASLVASMPDNPSLEDVLPRLAVKTTHGTYYTLQPDGFYGHIPQARDMLPNAFERAGLVGPGKLITLMRETNRGVRPYTIPEILREYVQQVEHEIVRRPGPPNKGWLEGQTLVFGSYSRNTLTPKFSPQVDRWLKHLGGERYEDLVRWLALSLAFERGPICALSIRAPKGSGKGLLVRGLTEATSPSLPAATGSIFGDWQYHLEETPWVHVDEGWKNGSKDIGITFRTMISGGGVEVVRKYGHPKVIYTNPRVVITANNRSCVETLFSHKDLTRSDIEAIAQRLFHFDTDWRAAAHLEELGGYGHTKGWVGGYNGEESEYVLAKHFLYLYELHKDDPIVGRFLMESQTKPELIAWLSMKSEHVAVMAQTLLIMFEQGHHEDGWVKVGKVKEVHDRHQVSRNQYTIMDIGKHLRLLTEKKDDDRRRKIDMQKLEFFANEVGKNLEVEA